MKPHSMQDRALFYADALGTKWPASVPTVGADGRLQGMWILGNDYRSKTAYWGSYPPNYLTRVQSLFPDAERVLHLFSGSLPKSDDYTRFDLRDDVDCDVRGDAHQLASHFPGQTFDIIYADPPYTGEDAAAYGTPMVNRNKIIRQVYEILEPGGFLVWLDMVLPMYRKVELEMAGVIGVARPIDMSVAAVELETAGVIGIVRSTNHRFRVVTIFRRL